MFDDAIVFRNKLIMVMGLQRSGTSALTEAIGQDPALQVETESENNAFYDNYFLRPEQEIRGLLWSIKRRVLLKPISEIQRRSVEDVLREYENYGVRLVWIYRDPVNVWSSMGVSLNVPDRHFDRWAELWVEGNRSVLDALEGPYADQIVVVRYEDLITQREMFTALCAFLGIEERNNLFWQADEKKGRRRLEAALQERIEQLTGPTLAALSHHRLRAKVTAARSDMVDSRYELSKSAWALINHGAATGTLEIPAHCPTKMRIKLAGASGHPSDSVQVLQAPVAVRAGTVYTLTMWARADAPRMIGCSIGQSHAPWAPLSEYHGIELTPVWRSIQRDFHVSTDELTARLCFDVAGNDAAVEISEVVLSSGIRQINFVDCHNEGKASIHYDPENVDTMRVVFESGGTLESDVQVVHSLVDFEKGERYIITFSARSDAPRDIYAAAGLAQAPWSGMGLYERASLTPLWKNFEFEFDALHGGLGRFYFDLGQSGAAVEITKVRVGRSSVRLDQLKVAEDCEARLTFPAGQGDTVRVEIGKIGTGERTDIQLSLAHRSVIQGKRYFVSFRGRADRPRRFGFGAQLACEPWTTLGIYRDAELTPQWRQFYFEFVANQSTDHARILFDLGMRDISLELTEVVLGDGIMEFTKEDIPNLRRLLRILEARENW